MPSLFNFLTPKGVQKKKNPSEAIRYGVSASNSRGDCFPIPRCAWVYSEEILLFARWVRILSPSMLGSYQRGQWSRCHQVQLFVTVVCPLPIKKECNCLVTDALKNPSVCQKLKHGRAFLWCSRHNFHSPITACFSVDEVGEYPLHVLC